MEAQALQLAISSLAWGLAGAMAGWWAISIVLQPRVPDPTQGAFEEARRQELRKGNTIYRWFEPLVDEWAAWVAKNRPEQATAVRHHLAAVGDNARWEGAEYVAYCRVRGMLAALGVFLVGPMFVSTPTALVLAGLTFLLAPNWQIKRLAKRGQRRLHAIKRRLSSALELMSLTMEVGASFQEAMQAVVAENRDHPLGDELGRVLRAVEHGSTRTEAFESLGSRLADDDVGEFVYAVVTGEKLGSPLADILRNQSDQLRQKRSQWAERASEEAQVSIVFPGMLIMLACLLVVAAPFVLTAMQEYANH